MDTTQAWDYLVHHAYATHEELILLANIMGYSLETLDKVAWARCGVDSVEKLLREDKNNG